MDAVCVSRGTYVLYVASIMDAMYCMNVLTHAYAHVCSVCNARLHLFLNGMYM